MVKRDNKGRFVSTKTQMEKDYGTYLNRMRARTTALQKKYDKIMNSDHVNSHKDMITLTKLRNAIEYADTHQFFTAAEFHKLSADSQRNALRAIKSAYENKSLTISNLNEKADKNVERFRHMLRLDRNDPNGPTDDEILTFIYNRPLINNFWESYHNNSEDEDDVLGMIQSIRNKHEENKENRLKELQHLFNRWIRK